MAYQERRDPAFLKAKALLKQKTGLGGRLEEAERRYLKARIRFYHSETPEHAHDLICAALLLCDLWLVEEAVTPKLEAALKDAYPPVKAPNAAGA